MGVYERSDSDMEETKKHCCCCVDMPEADAAADTAVPCCCRHKVRSPEEHKALLNRLNRLSDNSREVKLQILEQSVTNSWKGIFPLKGGQAQTRKEPKRYVE